MTVPAGYNVNDLRGYVVGAVADESDPPGANSVVVQVFSTNVDPVLSAVVIQVMLEAGLAWLDTNGSEYSRSARLDKAIGPEELYADGTIV